MDDIYVLNLMLKQYENQGSYSQTEALKWAISEIPKLHKQNTELLNALKAIAESPRGVGLSNELVIKMMNAIWSIEPPVDPKDINEGQI